jgi:hypothetical protein
MKYFNLFACVFCLTTIALTNGWLAALAALAAVLNAAYFVLFYLRDAKNEQG